MKCNLTKKERAKCIEIYLNYYQMWQVDDPTCYEKTRDEFGAELHSKNNSELLKEIGWLIEDEHPMHWKS